MRHFLNLPKWVPENLFTLLRTLQTFSKFTTTVTVISWGFLISEIPEGEQTLVKVTNDLMTQYTIPTDTNQLPKISIRYDVETWSEETDGVIELLSTYSDWFRMWKKKSEIILKHLENKTPFLQGEFRDGVWVCHCSKSNCWVSMLGTFSLRRHYYGLIWI